MTSVIVRQFSIVEACDSEEKIEPIKPLFYVTFLYQAISFDYVTKYIYKITQSNE